MIDTKREEYEKWTKNKGVIKEKYELIFNSTQENRRIAMVLLVRAYGKIISSLTALSSLTSFQSDGNQALFQHFLRTFPSITSHYSYIIPFAF